MNGKTPNKTEKQWLDQITQLGCIVCLLFERCFTPCEVHHTNGGDNHLETIGLCFPHHRGGVDNAVYTSRHPYKAKFEKRYASEKELLTETKKLLHVEQKD